MEDKTILSVRDYDLDATLTSGQAFRWKRGEHAWEGVVGDKWIRLRSLPEGILAQTARPVTDWLWLNTYLQTDVDLERIVGTFPKDEPMRTSVKACRGLRLLRQDPWECLASFILSSTKQIVQIQQIIALMCERFGSPLAVPEGREPAYSFPSPERLAECCEADLRACKMGFRAPNLLRTAGILSTGEVNLDALSAYPVERAREELMKLPGVGRKIADCVLLFGYGFQEAFPVDVWILKGLRKLYFPKRRPSPKRLRHFADTYFGPYAGYAQQYLFHYLRMKGRRGGAARPTQGK